MNDQLPVFVYGTLRTDEPNYDYILNGAVARAEVATVRDIALVGDGEGFPYALRRKGATTVGEVMWIDTDRYDAVLRRLDQLEGYHEGGRDNHYDRVVVTADLNGQQVEAYVYVAGTYGQSRAATMRPVPNGDWKQRSPRYAGAWA